MKTKFKLSKRILSLALALVMVVGMMPILTPEAKAATASYDDYGFSFSLDSQYCRICKRPQIMCYYLKINSLTFADDRLTVSFEYKLNCCDELQTSSETGYFLCTKNYTDQQVYAGCALEYSRNAGHLVDTWTTSDGKHSGNCVLCGNVEERCSGGTATCIAKAKCSACGKEYGDYGDHSWGDWTTSNGGHIRTCTLNTTHTESGNCDHKPATCLAASACSVCKHEYAKKLDHSYTYTADGFVLTETCTNGCGHNAVAKIYAEDAIYTGSEITNSATISCDSGTWAGDKPVLSFENNVDVGTATAKMTAGDATASTTFKINPANLSDATVELNPASDVYDGDYHNRPTYTLTYNGNQLVENTDYIVDANWSGDFLNAGDSILTLKGEGNFTGYKTLTYTIHKATPTANLFEMALPQNPVYDGTTTFPVTVTPKTTDLGEITAVKYNGSTEAPINAGTYKVTVNVEEGKNYNAIYDLELGSFTVAPTAGSIIIPANQSVVYDGAAVEQSDLTPAITTDGALTVKWYDSEGNEITAPADVGTYQIGISAAAGSNYNAVDEVKQTFTITKADPICTAPAARAGLVYNGKEQYLITPAESMDGTVYYSLDGDNYTESLPKGTNAQGYTVYYKVVGDANHNDMEPKTVTATIAPFNIGTASCKAGVRGEPFTYNGQEHTPTPQIDVWVNDYPVPGNPHAPGADVRLTEGTDYTVAYSDNVNAGEAVVTFTGKGNYTGTITRKFTIDPKELDGSAVSIPDMSLPYTGEAQTVAIVVPEGVTYELVEGTMTATNAGMYGFTIQFTGNHTGISTQGWQITAVAPNATAPTANTLTYNGEDQALIAAGATNDGTMVYSLEKEGEYKAELPKAKTAGTYHVWYKVIGDGNHTDSAPASVEVKIDKADPGIGIVTAGVVNDTLETYAIVLTRENTDIPGNLTVDAEQTLAWGDNTIRYTFTPEDTTNYKVVKGEVTVTVVDTVAPAGTVTVSTKSWAEFLNNITFGLFFKETQTVSVTASDNLSGVAKIEYIESKTALDLDAVKAATQWTEMKNGSVSVTLEDTKQFIYYIRITDKAGNVAFLSTDGAEYDTTAPVITGVDNGVTYYTTQKVTVTDKNIDTITLNGEAATDAITLEGNKEANYTIVATDKAGNSTTVTVTMKPIKELAKATENLGNDNVTSADAPALEELVAKLDELIADPDTSDDGERETLEQHKVIAEALLKTIEDVAKATDTENTAKVEDVTADNVTPEDKSNLEDAKADLEDALTENAGNYTDSEKKAIQDEIDRIDDALEAIENVEAAEETVSKLPAVDKVEPDDEDAIKAITDAKAEYDALTDHEKSLVDEDTKKKLDDLCAALVAYDIIKGENGKYTQGGSKGLSFTANGAYSKFSGILMDNKVVDPKHYTAESGSTIVTLKASYLDTLSTGKHTLTVVYTDGETSCEFSIAAKSTTPATGDDSNIMLYGSMFTVSLAAIIVLLLASKKRKQVS